MATKRFYLHKEAGTPAVPAGSYTISENAPDQTDANGGGGGHMSTSTGLASAQLNKPQARDNTSVAGEAPTTNPPAAAHRFGWFSDQKMLGQFATGDWKFTVREDDDRANITSHWSINLYANTTRDFASPIRFVQQVHLTVDNWTGTTAVQTQTVSVPGFRLTNEYLFVQIWCHETANLNAGSTLTIHQEGSDLSDANRTNILTSDFALGDRLLSLPGAAAGLAPASSTTAWLYGSYVQASASISTGIYVTGLQFQITNIPAVDTTVEQLFEIATGAAASEVTKVQIPYSFRADEVTTSGYYQTKTFVAYLSEPYFIAKGTRVSVRATDSITAVQTYGGVKIMYREAFDTPVVLLNAPADAAIVDTTPALDSTGTSEGSFDLEYNVQIYTAANYYFDGSDAAATDPNSAWTNDANAFDSDLTPSTTASTSLVGSTSSNYLMAEGTNAPTTGGAILQVRVRHYNSGGWAPYTTLSVPSGGWTWPKVGALEVKAYATDAVDGFTSVTIYTDGLAENLGTNPNNVGLNRRIYKIEVEVSSVTLDKLSVSDAGFTDVTNGADTHPFASGDQIKYTVQASDALAAGQYYWRAAAIDPLGGNIYGAWSAARSFTVSFPVVVLNAPADAATIADTTPALDFTGTSGGSFDLEYKVQVDTVSTFNSQSSNSGALLTGSATDDASVGSIVWATPVNAQASDSAFAIFISAPGVTFTDTTVKLIKYGVVSGDNKSTGAAIPSSQQSRSFGSSSDLWGLTLTPSDINASNFGVVYNSTTNGALVSHYLNCQNFGFTVPASATITGVLVEILYGYDGTRRNQVDFVRMTIYHVSPFFTKFSVTPDATFIDLTNGADTHPFASGDQIDYTVQAGDALAGNTYYWRVSAVDPLGGNVYGEWSATRSFIITAGATGIKVWNGTTWDYKPVKVWNGSAWVVKPVKVWNGSAWVVKG